MKGFIRDFLLALVLGMVLPGIFLNGAVMALERMEAVLPEASAEEIQMKVPEQTVQMNIRVRELEGTWEEKDLDEYLVGVVLAEMPASFEEEALKAQSVAARTYAWKTAVTGGKHGDGTVCTDSECCQGYLSQEDYISKNGNWESLEKVRTAVYATSGQVLTYEGQLIEATYFSCSGGSTEDAQAVWGAELPYLQAVDSPGEEAAAGFWDRETFSFDDFQQELGVTLEGEPEDWFGQTTYTEGGGVASLEIGGEAYAGTLLRSKLGLRSTAFSVAVGEQIVITTRGYGHRVGMSQYGADAMAVAGSTYPEILAHYYVGTELAMLDEMETADIPA